MVFGGFLVGMWERNCTSARMGHERFLGGFGAVTLVNVIAKSVLWILRVLRVLWD